jgi:hypothetical protein
MFLGFSVILELLTNNLPQNLLSLDVSGNQLSKSQIEIIRHCLGIRIRNEHTTQREISINIDSNGKVSLLSGLPFAK